SLPESSFAESFSLSASVPSLSTGQRGSLSPPYVFSGSSRPPDSPDGTTEDRYDATENDELEEQAAVEQAEDGSIVVDSDDLGTDAGYGTDNNTSASTSLAESVRDYIYENGRRYHKFREGRYNFPNDDVEQQREDMKHAMVKMLCGQLYFAPIGEHPHEILDIGTGTGIWAIEMGDLFPSSNVLGVDLSPIQPEWVPPNVRFMVDDIEWLHPRNYFDYVHSRHTVMAIKDWPRLMRRALEHIRPGGWFEMQEVYHYPISANNSMSPDHPVAQYWTLIKDGLENLGINFHAAANGRLADMMRDCGFVNVTERVLQIPIGTWPKNKVLKTVGLYWRTILIDGIQAIALGPLTRGCGWTREQVELFLIDVRRAYHDNSCLAYMPLHIVYGQKPPNY
ncbi:S-adenosyl-L-methionine-dependent methyltransferase, partial [Canariomyces notabilis]